LTSIVVTLALLTGAGGGVTGTTGAGAGFAIAIGAGVGFAGAAGTAVAGAGVGAGAEATTGVLAGIDVAGSGISGMVDLRGVFWTGFGAANLAALLVDFMFNLINSFSGFH